MDNEARVTGWWVFAAFMLGIAGTLNIIWGIAAISNSTFFVQNQKYIISDLNTWGWVTLILGVLEWLAAGSLIGGGAYGRWFGAIAASLSGDRGAARDPRLPVLVAVRVRAVGHRRIRAPQVTRGRLSRTNRTQVMPSDRPRWAWPAGPIARRRSRAGAAGRRQRE